MRSQSRPLSSAFARKAKRRTSLAKIRARAPKHPIGPEQQIRAALTRIFRAYHKHIRQLIVTLAHRQQRKDADTPDEHAIQASAAIAAHQLLYRTPFRQMLRHAAQKTADSAAKQTKAALKLGADYAPDLSDTADELGDRVFLGASELMLRSADRGLEIFDEWDDLDPETSPRAGDVSALGSMLDDGLDGITGTALAWAGLAFGDAFAEMIKDSQQEAGVSQAMWLSQRDSHVRASHLALDGEIFSWDDPPLKAEDADSGEDCFPGSDFGCRCVASAVDPDNDLTDRQADRLAN
jgi:SPP1 gp7 family putative phage head morphogenesis protein